MMDELPPVMDAQQLSTVLGVSEGSLAQDRYRGTGIPFVKLNKKVRYLREDVLDHFMRNRMFRTDGAVPGGCTPERRTESGGTGTSRGVALPAGADNNGALAHRTSKERTAR